MKTLGLFKIRRGKLHVQDIKDYTSYRYRCGRATDSTDKRRRVQSAAVVDMLVANSQICLNCLRDVESKDFEVSRARGWWRRF